ASAAWVDDMPETASIEARSHLGVLEATAGRAERGRQVIEESLKQARKTGVRWVEVECLLDLAQVLALEHRPQDILTALKDSSADGDRAIGRELQARVHYWRGRALSADGRDASAEYGAARTLIEELSNPLPDKARRLFALRPEIALITAVR